MNRDLFIFSHKKSGSSWVCGLVQWLYNVKINTSRCWPSLKLVSYSQDGYRSARLHSWLHERKKWINSWHQPHPPLPGKVKAFSETHPTNFWVDFLVQNWSLVPSHGLS